MSDYIETKGNEPTESFGYEVLPKPITVNSIYSEVLAKRKLREDEKKKKKKKGGGNKSKKDLDLEIYDNYLSYYNVLDPNELNPFMREQSGLREGNVIPKELKLDLYEDSGFFFGMKNDHNVFVGKPAHLDGHIEIVGLPGSGKTMAIAIPTMMTWRGIQIIIDVKGNLYRYWALLNGHTGKKVKLFSPGASEGSSCRYDPYTLLRHGGDKNLAGNARDLALALMPLTSNIKDPIWIQATQSFLTAVFIYYFKLGATFVETMMEIQTTPITDIIKEIKDDDNTAARVYINQLSAVQEKVISNTGMELSKLATLVADDAILNAFSVDETSDVIDWFELNNTTEPFDIILELPEDRLEQWKPMTMLMLNQLIKVLEQRPERTYKKDEETPPVLVMLDEFPRLGPIAAIKDGLSTLRSRGVTFALFLQGMARLDEEYGPLAARSISEICAYKIVLSVSDPSGQEYYSKLVGTTESTQRSISENHDPITGKVVGYGRSISETREPIIYPHEFLKLEDVVVINPHGGFCRVNKILFAKRENREMFLLPQLKQNRDYMVQKGIALKQEWGVQF